MGVICIHGERAVYNNIKLENILYRGPGNLTVSKLNDFKSRFTILRYKNIRWGQFTFIMFPFSLFFCFSLNNRQHIVVQSEQLVSEPRDL